MPVRPAGADHHQFGEGFLVWESNRSGTWRIWTARLDGTGLRQLSPNEPRSRHCCPHISPDGSRVAYVSFPQNVDPYADTTAAGRLRLITAGGSRDEVIAGAARTYGEGDRAAVWRSPNEIIFIAGDGHTQLLDLKSRNATRLTKAPAAANGWLLNATLDHATTGVPTFSLYDRDRRTIVERQRQGGCEPYFSHDGRWGYWIAGAGGPLDRIDLATGRVSTMIEKNDARLPAGIRYMYFPMLSRCGLLLAYGASANQHDHSRSDYEIFVVETDPRTLELIGPPVRLTHDPATDRYPDVYLAPLPLGRHFGEVPFTVRFPGATGEAECDFGDGCRERSSTHTYTRPGTFAVLVRQGSSELRGMVNAYAAQCPRPLDVSVRGNRQIIVTFDEPVDVSTARLKLESGAALSTPSAGESDRTLVATVARDISTGDWLLIEGVRDRAQRPNTMAPARLRVPPPTWPSVRNDLVFLWENAKQPNLVTDEEGSTERACSVTAHGPARYDRNYAMQPAGGSFDVPAALVERVLDACARANQLSFEATICTHSAAQRAAMVELTAGSGARKLDVFQDGDALFVHLRTTGRGPDQEPLFGGKLRAGTPLHVVVTYAPGQLVVYVDGEKAAERSLVRGDLSGWKSGTLVFGGARMPGWKGTIEGVAVYSRVLDATIVRESALRYSTKLKARPQVNQLQLQAHLVAKSRIPTLDEISPYRQALAVYEYKVERVALGMYDRPTIRIAHWVVLDGAALPASRLREGESSRLRLEPFQSNPQLESVYISDTLPADYEQPLFFDTAE
ncbi:MAG: LamG-like jellyroll fold domain-containing protein [Acidobacteriota bacterium]